MYGRSLGRAIRLSCLFLGILFLVIGGRSIWQEAEATQRYVALAAEMSQPSSEGAEDATGGTDGSDENGVDWASLEEVNPDVVAWLRLDGTAIDTPVVQGDDNDYYLHYDFWGQLSYVGCAFADVRCDVDGDNVLVFQHRCTLGGGFSEIYAAWDEDVFDGMGTLHWSTPGLGTKDFEPLCCLRVDKRFADIQQFSFSTDDEYEDWLRTLVAQASVVSDDAEELISGSTRAVTLSTCATVQVGQRWRTLVVFVR